MRTPQRPQFGLKKLFVAVAFIAILIVWCQALWTRNYDWQDLLPLGCVSIPFFLAICFSLVFAFLYSRTPGEESHAIGWLALAWLLGMFVAVWDIQTWTLVNCQIEPAYYTQQSMIQASLRALLIPIAGTFLIILLGNIKPAALSLARKAMLCMLLVVAADLLIYVNFSRDIHEAITRSWLIDHPGAMRYHAGDLPRERAP